MKTIFGTCKCKGHRHEVRCRNTPSGISELSYRIMTVALFGLFLLFMLASAVSNAQETEQPAVQIKLAEYCVAAMAVTRDEKYALAMEHLETAIPDFDDNITDVYHTRLILLVQEGQLSRDLVVEAAEECYSAYQEMTNEEVTE